ncbi:MAG: hypothetical protein ACTSQA_04005 [Candidatus Heimdallarchaeaceae archaeon]
MKKEQKTEYLKKLANSSEGEALIQHFNEKIDELRDASNYDKDNFERDGLASIKAADKLRDIIKDFRMLKVKTIKEKDQYN